MFERFTTDARRVVVSAQETARDLGHHELGDQHLLLGLLQTPGVAADVLRGAGADPVVLRDVVARGDDAGEALAALGIDLDEVRRRAEATFGPGALDQPTPRRRGRLPRLLGDAHLPLTPPARAVIEGSLRAARSLGHDALRTEHLLLGLLALGDSPGTRALRRSGVVLDHATAQAAVLAELRRSA
jgi:ATP-dependent Clp protease ATP-binding subunit ClpA